METWGSLPKSQVDNSTVDEEIAALIATHEADVDAHLEVGESLQSHKASEIIDHVAESVLNDKIVPGARAFVAVVDQAGKGDFTTIQDAIEYAYEKGGGIVRVLAGVYQMATNLQMKRFVDIQGNGKGETVIDFQNNGTFIEAMTPFSLGQIYIDEGDFTAGNKVVTVPAIWNLISDLNARPGMRVISGGSATEFYIASVDSETQFTLTENFDGATDTYDMYIDAVATFTAGSNIVTFPAGTDLTDFVIFPSFDFVVNEDSLTDYHIVSVDSDTQITMDINYAGVSGVSSCYIAEEVSFIPTISSMTLKNCSASYVFDSENSGYGPNVDDVEFSYCEGLYKSYATYIQLPKISNIYIQHCSGPSFFYGTFGDIENISGLTIAAAVKFFDTCDLSHVNNVRISFSTSYDSCVFYQRFSFRSLQNCNFSYPREFIGFSGASPYNASGFPIFGNTIFMQTGYHCDIYCDRCSIVGNYIYTTVGYNPRLIAGSDYNTVVGNASGEAWVDSGTGNEVAHNSVF